jgi:hypothetical protein
MSKAKVERQVSNGGPGYELVIQGDLDPLAKVVDGLKSEMSKHSLGVHFDPSSLRITDFQPHSGWRCRWEF